MSQVFDGVTENIHGHFIHFSHFHSFFTLSHKKGLFIDILIFFIDYTDTACLKTLKLYVAMKKKRFLNRLQVLYCALVNGKKKHKKTPFKS